MKSGRKAFQTKIDFWLANHMSAKGPYTLHVWLAFSRTNGSERNYYSSCTACLGNVGVPVQQSAQ